MDEQSVDKIQRHLKDENVQKRVQEDILQAREDATVTIGRAAHLFNFSESQLRDWEGKGLLMPRRSKGNDGQRLYDLTELDKLALIKELLAQGYSPGNIPLNIGDIWHEVYTSTDKHNHKAEEQETRLNQVLNKSLSIDARVEEANKSDFWHYYISQTLHIALSLIFEDISETIAGIILPLERRENATYEWESQDVSELGPCLIGWRDEDRTFHTFYQEVPSFDFPSDFRVRGLQANGEMGELRDPTFIVIQRKARTLSLPLDVVEAVRRLLKPIYEDIDIWLSCFKDGPRDIVYTTNVLRGINNPDSLLTFLANQVIRLGGRNSEGKDRWKFCCILLPRNSSLLLQMQTLVVQAQSERSPHTISKTSVSPDVPTLGLSQRAFQSIHMLFRSPISTEDTAIIYRDLEAPIRSAIAMPIGGENTTPLGVLYVVSEEIEAFGREYQRVLRLIGRAIKELLLLVQIRQQNEERLREIIIHPRLVNRTLASYDSENKLIYDVEMLLRTIKATSDSNTKGQTAFISIDIDNLTSVVSKYGDQLAINLSRVLGDRIRDQVGFFFDSKKNDYRIYHAYSDRFYIRLEDISLQLARENADKLRRTLRGNYNAPLISTSVDRLKDGVELNNITVRLGVLWYTHEKLRNLLDRYPDETQIADVRSTILDFLDIALNMGKQEGGDCIVSFYPKEPPFEHGRFALWTPSNTD